MEDKLAWEILQKWHGDVMIPFSVYDRDTVHYANSECDTLILAQPPLWID